LILSIAFLKRNLRFNPVVILEEGIKAYIFDIKLLHGTDI